MDEIKIISNDKIELNDSNYSRVVFMETKAIAVIKLINFLSSESIIGINPLDIIKQEFILKYNKEKLNDKVLHKIVISCFSDACNFLNNNLNLNIRDNNLYRYFE